MNMGYEDDELKPYLEPEPDYRDHKRIGESASMYITLTTYRLYVKCRARYEYSVNIFNDSILTFILLNVQMSQPSLRGSIIITAGINSVIIILIYNS